MQQRTGVNGGIQEVMLAHGMRVAATCLPKIHFQDGSENKYRSN